MTLNDICEALVDVEATVTRLDLGVKAHIREEDMRPPYPRCASALRGIR